MKEPVLVIMAAGMGSRYGGLKQLDPLGPNGEVILDYSLMDAKKAGFKKVVFIIKEMIKQDFMEVVYNRAQDIMEVSLAFQEVDKIPSTFTIDENREKPWGTAHAIYCAKDEIDGPFMVINADDYYGQESFKVMYDYLKSAEHDKTAMVGFELRNTLSENGTVSRGLCDVNEHNQLVSITEIENVEEKDNQIGYLDENNEWQQCPQDSIVSMNCFGFSYDFLEKLEKQFPLYLQQVLIENPLKGEIYLPSVVTSLILDDNKQVDVLKSNEKWVGVTYPEDKARVQEVLLSFHEKGLY